MDPFFHRVWTDISEGLHGPLTFRLIIPPTVATILAIRAGIRDAEGSSRTPFRSSSLGLLWVAAEMRDRRSA